MNFVKPTPEQIEKIMKSSRRFRFLHDGNDRFIYTFFRDGICDDFIVIWDKGSTGYSEEKVAGCLENHWTITEEDLAQLEDTSKRHKHYDIIKQWIEDPAGYDVYLDGSLIKSPVWNSGKDYRLEKKKPKPKVKKYKVLFRDGEDFGVTVGYYANEKEFQDNFCFDFIQLIQESEKEF